MSELNRVLSEIGFKAQFKPFVIETASAAETLKEAFEMVEGELELPPFKPPKDPIVIQLGDSKAKPGAEAGDAVIIGEPSHE